MTPAQFLARIKKHIPPAVLLLGPEGYGRRSIKDALTAAFPVDGVTQHDLAESSLLEALDDARSLSLFAGERLIWALNAEAALPRTRASEETDEPAAAGDPTPLADYLKDPTDGVTLVFDAQRFDFEGDDKRKLDRVRKFYEAVPEVVELRRPSYQDARAEAEAMAARAGMRVDAGALDLLVEALGSDVMRISVELEKLALFARGRAVTADDISTLSPEARATTVFALVNALGRRDRVRALDLLDTLVRDGEYLPLAVAFLSTQFRMALAAREAGLKNSQQIQSHFTRMGMPMWNARAEQVYQTAAAFRKPQLERALKLLFEADRGLRDARPDDRIVMEHLILGMTG
jgi:DNA polymerase III subunit delta